jgi:hypothetical protein
MRHTAIPRTVAALLAGLLLFAVVPAAQWADHRTSGIPRTSDGKLDVSAPAPRMRDGKPDLSGIWSSSGGAGRVMAGISVPFRPEAEAEFKRRLQALGKDNPVARCLPPGPGRNVNAVPVKIVQTADLIVMLYEAPAGDFRQVFLDARQLPKDPDPTWRGYSVGRWDGEALVVETSGFNDRMWLNITAHPHTKALRVTERYRRPNFGSLELQMTIDDAGAYTKPWTVTVSKQLLVDTELEEYVCENTRDGAAGRGK